MLNYKKCSLTSIYEESVFSEYDTNGDLISIDVEAIIGSSIWTYYVYINKVRLGEFSLLEEAIELFNSLVEK